jgi:hypothetical protein
MTNSYLQILGKPVLTVKIQYCQDQYFGKYFCYHHNTNGSATDSRFAIKWNHLTICYYKNAKCKIKWHNSGERI